MNIFRPQKPYLFRPPKYAAWFRPVLHLLSSWFLRRRFNIWQIKVRGEDSLRQLVRERQSVLVTPNHTDHADAGLLVHMGRQNGIAFHFITAREGFERSWLRRFVLQRSGAFSVDREGADLASIKTAMSILRECPHPLVIFPEGEIYHHHEELDALNEGGANSLVASGWLARRESPKRFPIVLLGLMLGGMVLGLNVTIVFLASCAAVLRGGR